VHLSRFATRPIFIAAPSSPGEKHLDELPEQLPLRFLAFSGPENQGKSRFFHRKSKGTPLEMWFMIGTHVNISYDFGIYK